MPTEPLRVRLIFADEGTFHAETVQIAADRLEQYERLIDLLREDPSVTRAIYVDLNRLVSAYVLDPDE
jgi:putative lipoic acid-binding regulatory protein